MAKTPQDIDDFLIVEDVDLSDESELRRVVADVEAFVNASGRGLRVSVLSAEQWRTVLMRMLKPSLRRGAERHVHSLRDPADPQHILVSPSMVRGVNEQSRYMYQALVYALLRCLPTELEGTMRKGLDDIIAQLCSDKLAVAIFVRNWVREAELVRAILQVLVKDFGFDEEQWALELRRNPDRVYGALRKSRFCGYWAGTLAANPRLEDNFKDQDDPRAAAIEMLRDPELSVDSVVAQLTREAAERYLEEASS